MQVQYLHFLLVLAGVVLVQGERQEQVLNSADTFVLGWEVDFEAEEITFDVTAQTTGFVGFGINYVSDMRGADIVIGGVDNNGMPYFADRHATSKSLPLTDTQQDWFLLEARENGNSTYLKFKRSLNTCDDKEDIIITKDTLTVIWSLGLTDEISVGHSTANRGGRSINFLDPPKPPVDLSKMLKWSVRVNDTIPPADTSYLCSFHKFEALPEKHHAIAMEVYLENQMAERHTHHFAATQCFMDDTTLLESLINQPALDCEGQLVLEVLKPRCRDMLFGWGIGGQLVVLPEHVGIEARPNEVYYVMLEMHYDNPDELTGLQYTAGFDAYFTPELRPNEGNILMVGAHILPSLIIPPLSANYVMVGHCSSEITARYVPPEGVNLVSVNMHSHIAGRKMRLRHYRDGKELPWLADDQNYDSNYQQTRTLSQEVKFMPGDQLTMECTYDTTWRNNVTLAGESTREEMCHAFIFYYPSMPLIRCSSGEPLNETFHRFGVIPELSLNHSMLNPTILFPEHLAGKTFWTVLNENVNWTKELREELAHDLRFGRHWASYELSRDTTLNPAQSQDFRVGPAGSPAMIPKEEYLYTSYPELEAEYMPEADAKCQHTTSTDVTTTTRRVTTRAPDSGARVVLVTPILTALAIIMSWNMF